MKKFIAILLSALFAFSMLSFGGCGWFTYIPEEPMQETQTESSEPSDEEKDDDEGGESVTLGYEVPDGFVVYDDMSDETGTMYCLEESVDEDEKTVLLGIHAQECDYESLDDYAHFYFESKDDVAQWVSMDEECENVKVYRFEKTVAAGFDTVHYEVSYKTEGTVMRVNIYEVYTGSELIRYMLLQCDGINEWTDVFEESVEAVFE